MYDLSTWPEWYYSACISYLFRGDASHSDDEVSEKGQTNGHENRTIEQPSATKNRRTTQQHRGASREHQSGHGGFPGPGPAFRPDEYGESRCDGFAAEGRARGGGHRCRAERSISCGCRTSQRQHHPTQYEGGSVGEAAMKNGAMVERALEDAREGLLSGNPAGLTAAAEALVRVESGLHDLAHANPGQLQRIQRRIRRLERLLEGARSFHEGLARIANAVDDAVANYTRSGATVSAADEYSSVDLHG